MKVTNIDLYKYFGWPKPNKYAKGILHGIFFDHDLDDTEMCPKRLHPIMLVIPGGGYHFVSQREANPVALAFLRHGFNAFWLDYSIAPKNKYPTMLVEAMMALTYLYKKAESMHSDPEKITVSGFSAGGHLAGMLASLSEEEKQLFYPYGKCGAHLRSVVLGYPVVMDDTEGVSIRNLAGPEDPNPSRFCITNRDLSSFPPCFIWTTKEDTVVDPTTNAQALKDALDRNGVKCQLVLYPRGVHGLSTGDENTYLDHWEDINIRKEVFGWPELAVEFINSVGGGIKD